MKQISKKKQVHRQIESTTTKKTSKIITQKNRNEQKKREMRDFNIPMLDVRYPDEQKLVHLSNVVPKV